MRIVITIRFTAKGPTVEATVVPSLSGILASAKSEHSLCNSVCVFFSPLYSAKSGVSLVCIPIPLHVIAAVHTLEKVLARLYESLDSVERGA